MTLTCFDQGVSSLSAPANLSTPKQTHYALALRLPHLLQQAVRHRQPPVLQPQKAAWPPSEWALPRRQKVQLLPQPLPRIVSRSWAFIWEGSLQLLLRRQLHACEDSMQHRAALGERLKWQIFAYGFVRENSYPELLKIEKYWLVVFKARSTLPSRMRHRISRIITSEDRTVKPIRRLLVFGLKRHGDAPTFKQREIIRWPLTC